MNPLTLELAQPDDWHLHLRDGAVLADLVAHTARIFARAIVMPNLRPPVRSVAEAHAYRERILAARPVDSAFEPLMTLYLTPQTTPAEVEAAARSPFVHAIKLYPAGATTNAEAGVRTLDAKDDVFAAMANLGLPLLVHAESTDPEVDVFDREVVFLRRSLAPMIERHAALKVVVEHITTAEAAAFVEDAPPTVAATITAHHLLYDRNAMFRGGLRPHFYCLPVLKRGHHRDALLAAATSGNPKFFLGTDSAPHERSTKENACGCAGIFTAHAALELYAEAFASVGCLDRLEGFASHHGPDFYRLARNSRSVRLLRREATLPSVLAMGDGDLIPLRAGETLGWSAEMIADA